MKTKTCSCGSTFEKVEDVNVKNGERYTIGYYCINCESFLDEI